MSDLSTQLQINQIRNLERQLFDLIDRQLNDKVEGKPKNEELAKRIDDLQTLYAKARVRE